MTSSENISVHVADFFLLCWNSCCAHRKFRSLIVVGEKMTLSLPKEHKSISIFACVECCFWAVGGFGTSTCAFLSLMQAQRLGIADSTLYTRGRSKAMAFGSLALALAALLFQPAVGRKSSGCMQVPKTRWVFQERLRAWAGFAVAPRASTSRPQGTLRPQVRNSPNPPRKTPGNFGVASICVPRSHWM